MMIDENGEIDNKRKKAYTIYFWLIAFDNSHCKLLIISILLTLVIKISNINFFPIQNIQYYKVYNSIIA